MFYKFFVKHVLYVSVQVDFLLVHNQNIVNFFYTCLLSLFFAIVDTPIHPMKDAYYTVEQEMLKETLEEVFLTNFNAVLHYPIMHFNTTTELVYMLLLMILCTVIHVYNVVTT